MRIVIQCADSKVEGAGRLCTSRGEPVSFVARPAEARASNLPGKFARPDDSVSGEGRSWRDVLTEYNTSAANPLNLVQAARLYKHPAYAGLVDKFGIDRVFILSAGWGLVRGTFLLPKYDITFSRAAERFKRRHQQDHWLDYRHLQDTGEPITLFGAKDYVPLFCRLTSGFSSPRTIYYGSESSPDAAGCRIVKYQTTAYRNWQYRCAVDFLEGKV